MNKIIVINYEGARFISGNLNNLKDNFIRDCGLAPYEILDQKTRDEIFCFFLNYSDTSDKLIIHIKSHGFNKGICQLHQDTINNPICDLNSIITWEELIRLFNNISKNCNELIVNLGTVCNSIYIQDCNQKMNFDTLVTTKTVSDPVEPRKINRGLISNINNVILKDGYELLRKNK